LWVSSQTDLPLAAPSGGAGRASPHLVATWAARAGALRTTLARFQLPAAAGTIFEGRVSAGKRTLAYGAPTPPTKHDQGLAW